MATGNGGGDRRWPSFPLGNHQTFGGFKHSGVGSKAGGRDYLLQFLEPRVITENVQRQGFAPIESVDD